MTPLNFQILSLSRQRLLCLDLRPVHRVDPPFGAHGAQAMAASAFVTRYYHTDALGSPVAISNEAGQVIERTHYEPWGAAAGEH